MTGQIIKVCIDDKNIECKKNESVLEAALNSGIYIPNLCYHPNLQSFGACGLCAVEIEGFNEPVFACVTNVKQGMRVITSSPNIKKIRRERIAEILSNHPHACLVCAEKEGCAREPCSLNVPVDERCCDKLGNCELERVAEYIVIPEITTRYRPKGLPIYEDNPFIVRDLNLCIGCGRCIRACNSIIGVNALGDLPDPPKLIDHSKFPEKLIDNGCQFCGLCVEVCPTGALLDIKERKKDITPCSEYCPAHIDIPKFIRYIANGKFSEALTTIYQSVPFPATLGYICNHQCEKKCRRGELDDPVSIRVLKRLAFNQTNNIKVEKVKKDSGRRVAVVGSGPAGLSCAFYLTQLGHRVTVFEAKKKLGGMLQYGIPTFRLPRDVINREIEIIKQTGLDIKINTKISSVDEIINKGFDAVFIGIGAQKGLNIGIKGEDDPRVIDALQFLNEVFGEITTNKDYVKNDKIRIGKCIAVIGGGNTAIDAARTAIRLGSEVKLFYRRTEDEMPAYPEEVKQAKKEGINLRFLITPLEVHSNKNSLKIDFIKMKLGKKDKSGRPRPIPIKNSYFSLEFDNIIIAIGQQVVPIDGIKTNSNNLIEYNQKTLSLGDGIYVGGDAASPSSVIESIAMGRRAAGQIHSYLGGIEDIIVPSIDIPEARVLNKENFLKKRIEIPTLDISKRLSSFSEVELSLDKNKGICEAGRCFQCDLCLYLSKVPEPPVDMLPFNFEKIELVPDRAGVFTLYDKDKKVVEIKGSANMNQMLKDILRYNDKFKYFKFEENPMYSKRESELLQQYIHQHGKMPSGGGDELDELF
jgi:NADPH-dependent glutamate synthase beta subunit-like oxidoreductase